MNIFPASNNFFIAGLNEKEAHNLSGDTLFDLYSSALACFGTPDTPFTFSDFAFQNDFFQASWDSDLDGFVIIFSDGKSAQTQTYKESNRLHADFGDTYIERYTEYDDDLSESQSDAVDDFVEQVNKIAYNFS